MIRFAPPDLAAIARVPALIEWMSGLSRRRALTISIVATVLILTVDYVTPPQYSFGLFYLLPVCVAGWAVGQSAGLLIGGVGISLSTAFATWSPVFAIGPATGAMLTWNLVMRLLGVLLVVVLVDGFRKWFDVARERAECDELTGLLNRRAFADRMQATLSLARRRNEWIALLYIDLDGFKRVNDLFGHAAGDLVLRGFAGAAIDAVRRYDHVARVGGDEFVILMPVASRTCGHQACERLYTDLSAAVAKLPYQLTCSAGAVIVDARLCEDHDAVMAQADKSMYEGKRAGRNSLRFARADINFSATLRDAFPLHTDDIFADILSKIV